MDNASVEFPSHDNPLVVLEYTAVDSDFGHIVTTIRVDGISCDHGALSIRGDGLSTFLNGLVVDWAGWDGTRTWESLRGELSIEASHLGSAVQLLFVIRQDEEEDAWELRLPVLVNPGEPLSRLARACARAADAW